MRFRNIFLFAILTIIFVLPNLNCQRSQTTSPSSTNDTHVFSKPGSKVTLDSDHYFTYGFVTPPKMGAVIMKVEIFTRDGKKDTSFTVKGDVDMPSMRGAHSTGDRDFSISEKGDYLLPVSLVMPGDWEFSFKFAKNDKTVLHGVYLFDL